MLNKLLKMRFACPVCGRILYKPWRGYWCPYCGVDLNHKDPEEIDLAKSKLTKRTDTGIPYYIGKFSLREKTFAQDMSISAIAEVLEKLAQYEEAEEENNRIIDELINQEDISE